ncbi:hypothetical protein [Methyloglobulus sp.]|uniref:hypothetical protein n=1 Tax=Methyloglobulus sp. TaxID=2518622 RepID=UPI00179DF90E|nr:hypothetical protein [Methyloglobulus sp.]
MIERNTTKDKETENLGVIDPRNTLTTLLGKAKGNLAESELKWLTGLADFVECETENLSKTLSALGCLVGSDENNTGSFQNGSQTSALLFSLSNQLDTLSGLAHVANYAQDRFNNPELYVNAEVAK